MALFVDRQGVGTLFNEANLVFCYDQRHLLRWLFFNLFVGNNDSHAKNLALLATPEGLRLAPFYDLLCTRVYSGLAKHFAFRIGGESLPGALEPSHLYKVCALKCWGG